MKQSTSKRDRSLKRKDVLEFSVQRTGEGWDDDTGDLHERSSGGISYTDACNGIRERRTRGTPPALRMSAPSIRHVSTAHLVLANAMSRD
ncbi:hypothetical protein EYF80_019822 [Liparis tanakae]|uniref:Uncharacterized protein n=1 Tax=Liparis tanakae TaxID=230148 RepID=A0A4Z2HVT3_9TELE|nr:hypothetical protein EYF80_019822 [Liparis tanakae]